MSNVVDMTRWGKKQSADIEHKLLSIDEFIRSRIAPPPVGSVVFNFDGGRVTITGAKTHIAGADCEIMIDHGKLTLRGDDSSASILFCSIHREIEELRTRLSE